MLALPGFASLPHQEESGLTALHVQLAARRGVVDSFSNPSYLLTLFQADHPDPSASYSHKVLAVYEKLVRVS